MKKSIFKICNEIIHPGEKLTLALPLPEIFSCAPLYMPIRVAHGKQPGPCLLITAAMHGNELNGTEIINRLFETNFLKNLHGTIVAIPVLNVFGLMNRSRNLPGGVNLDRCFPGSQHGTHASRMAYHFTQEVFSKADICIDLQTGYMNYTNLPHIYLTQHDKIAKELAEAFNAPVISYAPTEKGMLRALALKYKKPFLLYEAGEAMRFDEHSIKFGLKGILNVMCKLKMLDMKSDKKISPTINFLSEKNIWVYASTSGISHTKHKLGQHVKKNETLCIIKDPFGATDEIGIKSPEEAIIVAKNNLPLIYEGEALFQLAVFPKMKQAASQLSEWKNQNP